MAHGKAIFDYSDDQDQYPLLAQVHEDGRVALTFFDYRSQSMVTIITCEGVEHFLRDAADLIDPEPSVTCEEIRLTSELRSAQAQIELLQGAAHPRILGLEADLERVQTALREARTDTSNVIKELDMWRETVEQRNQEVFELQTAKSMTEQQLRWAQEILGECQRHLWNQGGDAAFPSLTLDLASKIQGHCQAQSLGTYGDNSEDEIPF